MTTAEQIINNCKKGLITIIQDDTENYMAFSNHKDYDGNYRTSSWVETIEEAKRCIGETDGYSEKEIEEYSEEYNWKIVEVYREEEEPFKVGDKVRLLDSIKKTDNWKYFEKCFPDMTGEIKGVFFNIIGGTHYSIAGWHIGHEYLAPLYEEVEVIKIGDKKYNKSEVEEALKNIKPL